jgi:hypothetical protein
VITFRADQIGGSKPFSQTLFPLIEVAVFTKMTVSFAREEEMWMWCPRKGEFRPLAGSASKIGFVSSKLTLQFVDLTRGGDSNLPQRQDALK